MSRYNDSSAVKLERFPVERVQNQTQNEQQQLEVLESKRSARAQQGAVPYGKYAVIMACVFAVAVGIVASYMQLAALNLENSKLRSEIAQLQSDENALNAKKEQIYNLAFVEDYAQNTLGMVKMDKSQIHYLEMDNGDKMVLAQASMEGGAQSAGLLEKLSQVFSTVLEYLN